MINQMSHGPRIGCTSAPCFGEDHLCRIFSDASRLQLAMWACGSWAAQHTWTGTAVARSVHFPEQRRRFAFSSRPLQFSRLASSRFRQFASWETNPLAADERISWRLRHGSIRHFGTAVRSLRQHTRSRRRYSKSSNSLTLFYFFRCCYCYSIFRLPLTN
jgi:hypothetical protein